MRYKRSGCCVVDTQTGGIDGRGGAIVDMFWGSLDAWPELAAAIDAYVAARNAGAAHEQWAPLWHRARAVAFGAVAA